jgi:hypothetical protein
MSDTSQGAGWWQASDHKWYPPNKHPGAVATAPPPPQRQFTQARERRNPMASVGRGCLMTVGAVVVLGVILVIVLAAAGSHSHSTPGEGTTSHPAAADVTVACAAPDSFAWHVTVTITNHSSQASNYIVTVEWDNAAGDRLQSGTAVENAVAPGQTATSDAVNVIPTTGGTVATCKASDVTRLST